MVEQLLQKPEATLDRLVPVSKPIEWINSLW